jgi:hypothetical protein
MKKTLLTILTLGMATLSMAQTHSMLSQNAATANDDGYNWNFSGSAANNCGPENALDYFASSRFSWAMGSGGLGTVILSDANGVASGGNFYAVMKMDNNDCGGVNDYAHLEIVAPCTVRVSLKTSVSGADLIMQLNSTANAQYVSSTDKTVNGLTADGNFHTYDFIFTSTDAGNMPFASGTFTDIEGISIAPAWPGGTAFPASIEFNWIEVGSAVGTHSGPDAIASTSDAQFAESISVYPNPAKDVLNVDLSAAAGAKEVKLIGSNGQVVFSTTTSNSVEAINVESFNKGIYMLQVITEGNTATKKVVLN